MKYANFAFRLIVALLLSQVVAIPTNIAGQSAQKPKVLYTQLKDLQGSLKSLASQKGNVAPEVLGNSTRQAWNALNTAISGVLDAASSQLLQQQQKPSTSITRRLQQALDTGSKEDAQELLNSLRSLGIKLLLAQDRKLDKSTNNAVIEALGLPKLAQAAAADVQKLLADDAAATSALSNYLLKSLFNKVDHAVSLSDTLIKSGLNTTPQRRKLNSHHGGHLTNKEANATLHELHSKLQSLMQSLDIKRNPKTTTGNSRRLQQATAFSSSSNDGKLKFDPVKLQEQVQALLNMFSEDGLFTNLGSISLFDKYAQYSTQVPQQSGDRAASRKLLMEATTNLLERYVQIQEDMKELIENAKATSRRRMLQDGGESQIKQQEEAPFVLDDIETIIGSLVPVASEPAIEYDSSFKDDYQEEESWIFPPEKNDFSAYGTNGGISQLEEDPMSIVFVVQPMDLHTTSFMISQMLDMVKDIVTMTLDSVAAGGRDGGRGPMHLGGSVVFTSSFPSEDIMPWGLAPGNFEEQQQGYYSGDENYNEYPPDSTQQRRRLQSHHEGSTTETQQQNRPSLPHWDTDDDSEAYDSYDDEYNEAEDWMWTREEDDLSPEELAMKRNNDLVTLVINLVSASSPGRNAADGSYSSPPALVHIMADPSWDSVSQLISLLESHAASLRDQTSRAGSGGDKTTTEDLVHTRTEVVVELPRFAMFGATPLNADSKIQAVRDGVVVSSRPATKQDQPKKTERVVFNSFGNAARAPQNYRSNSDDSQLKKVDARWLGLAFALGSIGLAIVGMSFAAMKTSVAQRGHVENETERRDDADPMSVGSPKKKSPEKERLLSASKPAAIRKTASNLPA